MVKDKGLEEEINQKYIKKDRQKKKKMKVHSKSVFGLKKIIDNKDK